MALVSAYWTLENNWDALLLEFLHGGWHRIAGTGRRFRLLGCAFCRQFWDKLTSWNSREMVRVAEKFADNEATWEDLEQAWLACYQTLDLASNYSAACAACNLASPKGNGIFTTDRVRWFTEASEPTFVWADLFRDIFFNQDGPYVLAEQPCPNCKVFWVDPDHFDNEFSCECGWEFRLFRPSWRTPDVLSLARAAHGPLGTSSCPHCLDINERYSCPVCQGIREISIPTMDNVTLCLLADALEEAGCEDAFLCDECQGTGKMSILAENDSPCMFCYGLGGHGILAHLRTNQPHVRGCWVLDLVLGRW